MEEDYQLYEIIPDGYDWGKCPTNQSNTLSIAMFSWDQDRSSKKLVIDEDQLTVKVKDGSGFKTSLGDQVRLPYPSPMEHIGY